MSCCSFKSSGEFLRQRKIRFVWRVFQRASAAAAAVASRQPSLKQPVSVQWLLVCQAQSKTRAKYGKRECEGGLRLLCDIGRGGLHEHPGEQNDEYFGDLGSGGLGEGGGLGAGGGLWGSPAGG